MMYSKFNAGLFCGSLFAVLLWMPVTVGACGWWGDSEKSSDNATIVRSPGYPMLSSAQLENADYLVSLGNRYRSTLNPLHDYSMALHFYGLAADMNHPGAQYNLGLMYELGLGIGADRFRAAGWYTLAANQGNVHAQHHLGELYIAGAGVESDFTLGLHWLDRAARSGHKDIFGRLGSLHWSKRDGVEHRLQATLWANLAVENGDQSARQLRAETLRSLSEQQRQTVEIRLQALKTKWAGQDE